MMSLLEGGGKNTVTFGEDNFFMKMDVGTPQSGNRIVGLIESG